MSKRLPPLPTRVAGILAPIRVALVAQVESDSERGEVVGQWRPGTRTIEIKQDLLLVTQWHILFHEQVHAWLDDTGARYGIDDAIEERVCDAIALGMVRALESRG